MTQDDQENADVAGVELTETGHARVTRLLCSVGFLRDDPGRIVGAVLRQEARRAARKVDAKLKEWNLRKSDAAPWGIEPETPHSLYEPSRESNPEVIVGRRYVRWFRRRITAGRPVPANGFDMPTVLEACELAAWVVLLHRVLVSLSLGMAVVSLLLGFPIWASAAIAIVGPWGACYLDECLARGGIRALVASEKGALPQPRWLSRRRQRMRDEQRELRPGTSVVPYRWETGAVRGRRFHMIGFGDAWQPSTIGIDVFPAQTKSGRTTSEGADADASAFPEVKPFTPDDLHDHVADRLLQAADPKPLFHSRSQSLAFGVAVVPEEQWARLSRHQWDALSAFADKGRTEADRELLTPENSYRMLCVQKISFGAELVASVFVSFAYEDNHLSLELRPHAITPIAPAVTGACGDAERSAWSWHLRAQARAALRVVVPFVSHFLSEDRAGAPELDSGKATVSLREAYSAKRREDVIQYDHAGWYVDMLRDRILDAVEVFLEEHNVDTKDYREKVTYITNNINNGDGVVITGNNAGSLQNQVGNANAQQRNHSPGGAS
ncbi:hypothetical protein RM780_13985 [Streptomyces sp. DSM 44917]|uniref:Aromatic ring-opening dioxygenase LigA n=1 Tax=Streptomyces boetiae TaxID=3075541 RepID=A0ABU2L917_9ACTN|nr:hypothetical protein [Streptomyces sp. DSM 44917]MDT0308065.1 hypothetical protein [Streptomyces sp. DSM 44917]